MENSKKYGVLFLKVLLAFSLVLPYCCHAGHSEHHSHQQKISIAESHAHHHGASECNCGHELSRDFHKAKKILSSPSLNQFAIGTVANPILIQNSTPFVSFIKGGGVDKPQKPPLHLLNSVFLN